jgi:colicin import membrane protein
MEKNIIAFVLVGTGFLLLLTAIAIGIYSWSVPENKSVPVTTYSTPQQETKRETQPAYRKPVYKNPTPDRSAERLRQQELKIQRDIRIAEEKRRTEEARIQLEIEQAKIAERERIRQEKEQKRLEREARRREELERREQRRLEARQEREMNEARTRAERQERARQRAKERERERIYRLGRDIIRKIP